MSPAPVRAAIAELFPSHEPSMESSRLTDCSKFNISLVCSLTVFVRFERFDVFCSTTVTRAVVLPVMSRWRQGPFEGVALRKCHLSLDSMPEMRVVAAIATVFKLGGSMSMETSESSARRPLTSDALVTVFDAVLAMAVSKLEFRAITLASVSLRDVMIPSMRLV